MPRSSGSEIAHKQQVKALRKEKQELEEALLRLKKDKFALADKLHWQEEVLSANRSGLFEWKIGSKEFYLQFPWKKVIGESREGEKDFGKLLEFIVPEHRFSVKRMFWKMAKGINDQYQLRVKMLNNSTGTIFLLIKAALVYDENKKPLNVAGTLLAIEQEAVAEQESLSLLDHVPAAILKADREGNIRYQNKLSQALLTSLHRTDMVRRLQDVMGEEVWHNFNEELTKESLIEYWSFSPEENKHWQLNAQYSDRDIFLLIQEVSEQVNTIEELQQVNVDLDNFVYHASHDLRAPLRTVLGMLGILKSETNKEQRKRCVDLIEGSIKRLDTLVVDLLSISRNKRSTDPLVKINFMVEVNLAVANFYHVGNTKNLEITTKISQPVSFVSDLTRVRIILNNLVSNAIKYRRYYLDRSFIDIRIWVDEAAAHIEIEDNGEGIPEEELPRIFDMFSRASERSEGSGLGLYIVKDVLHKLNGKIDVQSTFDKGSTFAVTIPNQHT
ncbi:signal transduction histidine kinase [Catalinimonas alkaloidigena]|uniref:sensor histidine kinase n=1 Tax=Catalinimonas alkaloidigena TaxID=1075417 RepID=UPI002404E09E|nr:HAMP domain-containing sensor histidine kinase [Catalinimonas alkaloidigena]MDF9795228.1 signal transduction histidine kinase [Catalinimonas alkaloidigena]